MSLHDQTLGEVGALERVSEQSSESQLGVQNTLAVAASSSKKLVGEDVWVSVSALTKSQKRR